MPRDTLARPSIAVIQTAVCARFSISMVEMLAFRRDRYVMDARHAAMWLCRRASYTFSEVGRGFDRHHTAVMHAVRRVDRLMRRDSENATVMASLLRILDLVPSALWPPRTVP